MQADPLADALDRMADSARNLVAVINDVLVTSVRALADVLGAMLRGVAVDLVRRFAVERMGVTEADVRSVEQAPDGSAVVRLWNHRRLPVDRDQFGAWLDARVARG